MKRSLKILMLVDAWFPHLGGGQIHAWELSKELTNLGHKVKIITRDLGSWENEEGKIAVLRIGHFKEFRNFLGRVEYLVLAIYYCLKEDYDILHTHAFSPGLIAPLIKYFRKKPVVFTAHGRGMSIAGLGLHGEWLQNLVFYKFPFDLFISVAKNTLEKKSKSRLVKIIPNGIDINRFSKIGRERDEIKRILFVGRLSFEKGCDMLIEAFKRVRYKQLKLVIIGDGVEIRKLKKRAENLPIVFKGRLEGARLLNEFKKADLLVIPSRTEGHPLTLFEGWAAKLPIVATKVGDIPRFIKDGINGFLVEPNVNSIALGINRAMKSRRLILLTNRGLRSVEKYSWRKIAEHTEKNYRKIIYA